MNWYLRHHMSACLVGVLLSAALPAGAQQAGIDRIAAARALFRQGMDYLEQEAWQQAADRFSRAMALRSSPRIAYNLTTALIPLGQLVRSSELLRNVVRDPTVSADVRSDAEARLAELEPRLAWLTMEAPPGVTIFFNGVQVAASTVGVPVPVDPGRHSVVARINDTPVFRRQVAIEEGARRSLRIDPTLMASSSEELAGGAVGGPEEGHQAGTEGGSPGATAQDSSHSHSRNIARRWWFWTALGVVVAGGAVLTALLVTQDDGDEPAMAASGVTSTAFIGGTP
jgi:hypothetical protein